MSAKPQILILDDDEYIRDMLNHVLKEDYFVFQAENGQEALVLMRSVKIDLVLVDLIMPGEMGGVEFIEKAHELSPETAYIIVSGNQDVQNTIDAFHIGIGDYIQKPIDSFARFKKKVSNVLEKRDLIQENRKYKNQLEELVQQRTRELEERNRELQESRSRLVGILSKAAEYKDNETGRHFIRVSKYSMLLARACRLDSREVQRIQMASPLHDIGKIGIPESVLLKRGRLDREEYREMQKHTLYGGEILSGQFIDSLSTGLNITTEDLPLTDSLLECAVNIARYHHENYDGSGYPYRLLGEEIPLEARIVSIADVFDALGSSRPYKRPWTVRECFDYLEEQKGRQFDPELVDVFLANRGKVLMIKEQFHDDAFSMGNRVLKVG